MTAFVLACLLAAPNQAAADAAAHFAAGEYEAALIALDQAYAFEADPNFIFAQGSALQRLGRFEQAIDAYTRFLATSPPLAQGQTAYERIQQCRDARQRMRHREDMAIAAQLERAGRYEEAAQAYSELRVGAPTPEDAQRAAERMQASEDALRAAQQSKAVRGKESGSTRDTRPWHRDVAGGVLLGAGLGVAATGGVLVALGARKRGRSGDASTEGAFRSDLRGSNISQGIGIGVAVAGGALLVGAVVRYTIVHRGSRRAGPGLSVRF